MTGRELIVYILENHLEDADMFADGRIIGLDTVGEYAAKMNVGPETVKTWAMIGMLDSVIIYGRLYIPSTALPHDGRER